ncbi:MAG: ABC transporter permease [Sulfolobales archaeon]
MLRSILIKELLEIIRDKKLLIGTIILPFLMLPLIGGILFASVSVQKPIIEIINNNPNNLPYVNFLKNYIINNGGYVIENDDNNTNQTPSIVIIFPNDFYINASSLNKQTYILLRIVISTNEIARNIVFNALYYLSYNISLQRISEISKMANLNISPSYVRDPLVVVYNYLTASNEPTTQAQNNLASLARVIALILFPSATPVVFYTIEGIVGERERKTLESLLSSPISPITFITAKVIVGVILGIISSIGDLLGILIFSSISSLVLNLQISLTLSFLTLVVLIYVSTIILTASLSLLLLLMLGGSLRNIQLITIMVTGFGVVASFTALFLDFSKLTFPANLLLILPYMQLSGSLMLYVFGLQQESIFYISVTLLFSILLIYLVSRRFDSERILLR